MSEREPEISASTTDTSASTAEFRRFVSGANAETAPPWSMRAPGKRVALLAIAVIVIAVILGVVAIIVINM
jgi:hypothetical protein